MAMNKKEKEYLEKILIQNSFKWCDDVKKDVPPPSHNDSFSAMTIGYTFNSHSMVASKSCSSCVGHSIGNIDKTTTQNSIHMFSTRLMALKAMRFEMVNKMANELRKVDLMIEEQQ